MIPYAPDTRRLSQAIDAVAIVMAALGIAGLIVLAYEPAAQPTPREAFQPAKFTLRAGLTGLRAVAKGVRQ